MKPLFITCAGADRRIYNYLESFSRHVQNADLKTISFRPHFKEASIKIEKSYPGHIDKYEYFRDLIEDDFRWYIFTDMYDVVFLKDLELSLFQEDKSGVIYVSSENHFWKENSYYGAILKQDKFKSLLEEPVYCSGTFAMQGHMFIKLIDFFKEQKRTYKGQLNQPLFNLFVQQYSHIDMRSLFMTLHQGIDKGLIQRVDRHDYSWSDGVVPTMVHGNGSYFEKYMC